VKEKSDAKNISN